MTLKLTFDEAIQFFDEEKEDNTVYWKTVTIVKENEEIIYTYVKPKDIFTYTDNDVGVDDMLMIEDIHHKIDEIPGNEIKYIILEGLLLKFYNQMCEIKENPTEYDVEMFLYLSRQ